MNRNGNQELRPLFLVEIYWFNQQLTGKTKNLLAWTMKMMFEGGNQNKHQEAQNWTNQETKPGTLFLVGSWLRPYNFGFGRTLTMGDNLNARRSQYKMISLEDVLNGRKPQWLTTSMDDKLNGNLKVRWLQIKMISKENNLYEKNVWIFLKMNFRFRTQNPTKYSKALCV